MGSDVRPYQDPVTGDRLTRGEWFSWRAQSLIRHWSFIVGFTTVTFTVWILGSPLWLSWWNYAASWLALVIESLVGIAMFGQTRRDAVILRGIRSTQGRLEELGELLLEHLQRQEEE